jgi:hypothetical protein
MRRMNLRRIAFAVNAPGSSQIRVRWIALWVVLLLWISTGYSAAQATPPHGFLPALFGICGRWRPV